jgi:hypothetical protein
MSVRVGEIKVGTAQIPKVNVKVDIAFVVPDD